MMLDAGWWCSGQTKDENKLLQQKLRAMLGHKEPTISMSELVEAEHKAASDHSDLFVEQLDDTVPLQPDQTSKFVAQLAMSFFS